MFINHVTKISQYALNGIEIFIPVLRRYVPVAWRGYLRKLLDNCQDQLIFLQADTQSNSAMELCNFKPICDLTDFTNGSIVMVNNALGWGGVERQIVYLLQALPEHTGRDVTLLCMQLNAGVDYQFYLPLLKNTPVEVIDIRSVRWARKQLNKLLDSNERLHLDEMFKCLPADVRLLTYRFLVEFLLRRPAVVHAWQDATSIAAGFAAVIAGVPRIILSSRNVRPTHFAYYRSYMMRAYQQLAACKQVILVNNSEYGAADYADWLGLNQQRYVVKRNGIDPETFQRSADSERLRLRETLGIPIGVQLVGSVFRLYAEKRPLLWVEVASRVSAERPDAHFVIFGTGPMRDDIKRVAQRMGLADRLHLPGTTDNAVLAISSMDVFLLTSSFEGTPNVVLEAQLLGVPVVATDAGGTKETLDSGKTGWLITEPEPKVISRSVLALLADPNLAAEMGAAGRAYVISRYGLQLMIDETLALYNSPSAALVSSN